MAINWVPEGISRVNVSWFYIHNLVGLIYTPMGLAAAYYFLPKLANTPIYSHRLSMIGFWSIAFVYAWVGTHHMLHGPISQWMQTTIYNFFYLAFYSCVDCSSQSFPYIRWIIGRPLCKAPPYAFS